MSMFIAEDFLRLYDARKIRDASPKVWHDNKTTRNKIASMLNKGYKAPETRDPHRKHKPHIKRPSWMRVVKDKKPVKKVSKKDKRNRFQPVRLDIGHHDDE